MSHVTHAKRSCHTHTSLDVNETGMAHERQAWRARERTHGRESACVRVSESTPKSEREKESERETGRSLHIHFSRVLRVLFGVCHHTSRSQQQ